MNGGRYVERYALSPIPSQGNPAKDTGENPPGTVVPQEESKGKKTAGRGQHSSNVNQGQTNTATSLQYRSLIEGSARNRENT